MRLLLVNARRGFGNRVRAMLSGAAYAESVGARFEVVWAPNQQCGATLGDLWHHPFREVSLGRARIVSRLGVGWVDHLDDDDFDVARYRRPVLALQSSQPFSNPTGRPWTEWFSRLVPLTEHRTRIDELWSSLPGCAPVIGAMVRIAPDAHASTTESDPMTHNLRRLAELRRSFPSSPIFLSADSPAAVETVRREVADVWALPDKGAFNSARGIQDALCDTYLLASCSWIVGSHGSSFSENAGLIAGHGGYETSVVPATADPADLLLAPRLAPSRLWAEVRSPT